jgi:hypothetical protein
MFADNNAVHPSTKAQGERLASPFMLSLSKHEQFQLAGCES